MSEPDWDPKWGPPPPRGSTDAVEALRREVPGRPAVLEVLVLVSVVSGLWSLGMMYGRVGLCTASVFALDFALIYFLWAGRNWARMLVQLISLVSLVGFAIFLLPRELARHVDLMLQVKVLFDASLGLASLIVLNTAAVRAYFHGPPITRPRA